MLGRALGQLVVALVVAVLAAVSADAGEERVALVIGNGAYTETAPLANPANDANDVAAALEGLGFEVIKVVDGDKLKMERAVRSFSDLLASADVSLFFYAGHGLQVGGRNYLLPTNAKLLKEQDLLFEAIDVRLPLRVMDQSGARVKIVILDACRNNPLASSLARSIRAAGRSVDVGQGLASLDGAAGTLIAFATAPEAVAADGKGRNSPFTKALLQWIGKPRLEVRTMFGRVRESVWTETNEKQLPWVNEALLGDFYFADPAIVEPSELPPVQTAALPPPTVPTEPEIEPIETEYVAIKDAQVRERPTVRSLKVTKLKQGTEVHVAGKVKDTNWYLVERDNKPLGYVFGDLLKERQQATLPEALPPTVPALNTLSEPAHRFGGPKKIERPDRRPNPQLTAGVQRALAALGYDPGPVDGVAGPQTREAIGRFQVLQRLPVDREVSERLLAHLWREVAKRQPSQAPSSPGQNTPRPPYYPYATSPPAQPPAESRLRPKSEENFSPPQQPRPQGNAADAKQALEMMNTCMNQFMRRK